MVIAVMPRKRRRSYGGSSHMLSLLFSKLFCAYPLASVAIKRSHQQHGGETMRQWSRRDVHRRRGSAEGERKSLHARIEKLDIELSVSDGLRLSDQLVQPRCGHRAVAVVVYGLCRKFCSGGREGAGTPVCGGD